MKTVLLPLAGFFVSFLSFPELGLPRLLLGILRVKTRLENNRLLEYLEGEFVRELWCWMGENEVARDLLVYVKLVCECTNSS